MAVAGTCCLGGSPGGYFNGLFVNLSVTEGYSPEELAEAEWDRIEGLAHYSAGRTFEAEGRTELALRRYQRALRYNPQLQEALESALRLAVRLGRFDEACRLLRVYRHSRVAELAQVLPIAVFMIQRGNYADAADILELVLDSKTLSAMPHGELVIRLEVGRLRSLAGDFPAAAAHFRKVVDVVRKSPSASTGPEDRGVLRHQPVTIWRLMGATFLEVEDYDLAEYCFREAFKVEGHQALLEFDLARVHKARQQYSAAEAALNDYLKAPRDAEGLAPYRLLSEILRAQGRQEELLSRLVDLNRVFPDLAPLAFALAEEYFRQGLVEESILLAEKLLETRPTVEVWRHLVVTYRHTRQWEKLLALLGRMQRDRISLESVEPYLRDELSVEEIRGPLLKALETTPLTIPGTAEGATAALALVSITAKDFPTAKRLAEQLWQSSSPQASEIFIELAFALAEEDQLEEACELMSRALERARGPAEKAILQYYLAGFLEVAGRTDEALVVARQAAEISRESPRFHLRLAWILLHSKRYEEATIEYRKIVERWETDHSSSEVRAVVRETKLALSHLADMRNCFEEAEEWLQQVLDEFPEDPTALNDLGYMWAERNIRLYRALRMIRKAVEAEPENPAFRDSLGWVLFRLGRFEEAVQELEKAAAAEADPVIFDHLGEAYLAINRLAQARKAWEQSIELFLSAKEPEKAEKVRQKMANLPSD